MNLFNIHLEFNREKLFSAIERRIAECKPGYVCVCDSSVLSRTYNEPEYRKVINGAFENSCDGSSICTLATKLYGGKLESVNGPEIFAHYTHIPCKQVILGHTEAIVKMVRDKLHEEGVDDSHITHMQLPFCKVDEFDYKGIAEEINREGYDIIWVSLGNPKQEIFMSKMLPYLKKGVMFGIGAALNFWVGDLALPKFHIGPMRFIWLTRLFQDPVRQIKMNWIVLKTLPKLYREERKRIKMNRQ